MAPVRGTDEPVCSMPCRPKAAIVSRLVGMPEAAPTPADATNRSSGVTTCLVSIKCRAIASAIGLRQVFPVQKNRIVRMVIVTAVVEENDTG